MEMHQVGLIKVLDFYAAAPTGVAGTGKGVGVLNKGGAAGGFNNKGGSSSSDEYGGKQGKDGRGKGVGGNGHGKQGKGGKPRPSTPGSQSLPPSTVTRRSAPVAFPGPR